MLQRLSGVRERLDAEEERIAGAQREVESRIAQIDSDSQREASRAADAARALAALAEERDALVAARSGHEERETEARAAADAAAAEARAAQEELNTAVTRAAAIDADRAAAQRALSETSGGASASPAASTNCRRNWRGRRPRRSIRNCWLPPRRNCARPSRPSRRAAPPPPKPNNAAPKPRRRWNRPEPDCRSRRAKDRDCWPRPRRSPICCARPMRQHCRHWPIASPSADLEAALGAALGDDLAAPCDVDAPSAWRTLMPYAEVPSLPVGVVALAAAIAAPEVLARRLSQIGLIETRTGRRCRRSFCPASAWSVGPAIFGAGTVSRCGPERPRPRPRRCIIAIGCATLPR